MADELTGVEQVPAAGEQEELTVEDLFGGEETGVEEAPAAGEEVTEEGTAREKAAEQEERTEVAFAKRLSQEREKLRDELREEVLREVKAQQPQQAQQQPPQQQMPPTLTNEQAERIAEELDTTPQMARLMYDRDVKFYSLQQQALAQARLISELSGKIGEGSEKEMAKREIAALTAQNPSAPPWDENEIGKFREDYQRKNNRLPSWRESYSLYVAEQALSGKLARQTQQQTLREIAGREKSTVQITSPEPAKKVSVEELSVDVFNKLIERAKQGEFKRS